MLGLQSFASGFEDLAGEVELERAMRRLLGGQVEAAVAIYKSFERRSQRLVVRASTNISFVYLLEGDIKQATKYVDLASSAER